MRSKLRHPLPERWIAWSLPLSSTPTGTICGLVRSPKTSKRIVGCFARSSSSRTVDALADESLSGVSAFVLSHPVAAVSVRPTANHTAPAAAMRTDRMPARSVALPAAVSCVITRRVGSMDASLRGAQRLLGEWIPRTRAADGPGPTLETLPAPAESPRLEPAQTVEGPLRTRAVTGEPRTVFGGFLDGTQASRIVTYVEAVPIVFATVAAVIRVRRDRRLATYGQRPEVE